ncbi:4-alpha-glucanotransferase [Thermomonospora echinospora]|uniref:4-alpha-glucanotransferase n=1 Tax=Thermomonospora echinospora TaxID=1992 RepID=UPI001F416E72|nr:4-alpha-glucanotransferase [Thermomonospora echinospora]
MADEQLIRLARGHRVGTGYVDWRGREAAVPRDTIVAVLAALGVDASTPAAVRAELARLEERGRTRLLPPVVVYRAEDIPVDRHRRVGTPSAEVPLMRPDEIAVPASAEGITELSVTLADGETVQPLPAGHTGGGRGAHTTSHETYRLPEGTPPGWHRLHVRQGSREQSAALLVAPSRLGRTARTWGLMAQLYSVRSRASWAMGDLRDLADLAAWSARDLGADFVLVNPLHAAEPALPVNPSPYSPMSRRFAGPLYLRVEDVPEYAALGPADRERVDALARPLRENVHTLDEIDRNRIWEAKRAALELLHRQPRGTRRQQEYERFRAREGDPLTAFATWCALAEEHGSDWRRWPAELQDPHGPAVTAARERLAGRVDFHAWLQWQLDEQLAAAQSAARASGMALGVVHDLAVGVGQGSADAWIYRSLFAPGMSVGAPPDEFNQRGQDWGQPPWHPERLAEAEYAPYRSMLAAALRHGGGLRLDHAMQVSRLWWVPEGFSPADGTYVGYDRNAMLSCLVWEAARTGAVVVGEDLGTVEPEVREDLASRGILGTSLLWFERDREGRPRRPAQWREPSLATVGTHDMPPITGFLHGDHVGLRERLGLLTRSAAEEEADHRRQLTDWLALLAEEGLLTTRPDEILRALAAGSTEYDEEVVTALHALLARTPARLVGIALADAVGERRTQNQPGTSDEYPNWRVPLADAKGRPVLLDDLPLERIHTLLAPVLKRGASGSQDGDEAVGDVAQQGAGRDGSPGDRGDQRGQAR